MTLRLDFNSLTSSIINYLAANSSTIDSNLYDSLTTIVEIRPEEFSLHSEKYPAISVDLIDHEEERLEIGPGANARRLVTCNFEIGCHMKEYNSYTKINQDMRTFVANVEFALRTDDTLSSNVSQSDIISTEFGNIIKGKTGRFQKNGLIRFQTINEIQT